MRNTYDYSCNSNVSGDCDATTVQASYLAFVYFSVPCLDASPLGYLFSRGDYEMWEMDTIAAVAFPNSASSRYMHQISWYVKL